jgi:hypothetical protein
MATYRVGIDVALYCEKPTLATACLLDFKKHVTRLLHKGAVVRARRLWNSVFEIVHLPAPPPDVIGVPGLPPLHRAVCTNIPCQRCDSKLGGFQFPWLGTWCHRGVIVPSNYDQQQAWAHYYASMAADAFMDLLLLEPLRSPISFGDILPVPLQRLVVLAQLNESNEEEFTEAELLSAWRDWQQGDRVWRDPSLAALSSAVECRGNANARAGRALWGWLGSLENGHHEFPPMCRSCGDLARFACTFCASPLCTPCMNDYRLCPTCSCSRPASS